MIEPRFYRTRMGEGRFTSFLTGYKDTDLWIGMDPASFLPEIKQFCFNKIKDYRTQLENYLVLDPLFGKTLVPHHTLSSAPDLALVMSAAAQRAGVGPMAAIAGAVAQALGNELLACFQIKELVIENGGDIFLFLDEPLIMSVFAGNDPLSERIGIEIPKQTGRIGVCTSSGKVGPSLSFGRADAVMVACKDTALADAWATSLGNQIKTSADIEQVLKYSESFKEILSLIIICDGQVGIRGNFQMKILG